MASVFQTILDSISDHRVFFVFPSETAAVLWARKICLYGTVRSVARERFIAWDHFKEETIRRVEKDRRPVSSLIRRLFAHSLARKNAAGPFLQIIIPAAFAANGGVFADSIASMLGSLGFWEEKLLSCQGAPFQEDDEDRDLRVIKTMYAAFLDERGLFEPAWEKAPFRDNDKRYIIFFPETLADFAEYEGLFKANRGGNAGNAAGGGETAVRLYTAEELRAEHKAADEKLRLLFFDSARREIRSAALELRRLHEEAGLAYEDMALTLPDFAKMEPYVSRELALHDIPFNLRAGKNLGEYPAGRLFSLIGHCVSSFFSFDALKPLLLDPAVPWKDRETNRALINYGIANHCAAPFRDRGRTADPWEEGFKRNPDEELAAYYGELKQHLSAMTAAKTFGEIREKYHSFRSLLDIEQCGDESNAVLARCIEELAVLIEAEAAFPDLIQDPFDFFVSHLKEKNYVYVREQGGVNIYDYPVAAGAPFGCHMVLNVSQAAAALRRRPLAFLRQDKRARLGLEDRDMSAAALALYSIAPWKDYSCHSRVSASEKTFAGWAIPHSAFVPEHVPPDEAVLDIFTAERKWRAALADGVSNPAGAAMPGSVEPPRLFSVQRRGFENWSAVLLDETESAVETEEPAGTAAALLRERIANKNTGDKNSPAAAVSADLSVSATDLNEFFKCPVLWLYRRIFHLEPHLEDAALLDDEARGLLYHRMLHLLFERIKKTDTVFIKKNLAVYFEWIEEISSFVLRSDDVLKGPLVYPLLAPLASAMGRRLRALLKTEAVYFSGCKVGDLEKRYDLFYSAPLGNSPASDAGARALRLSGRIDRVSAPQGPEGPVIIDYKTNILPSIKQCRKGDDGIGLKDFQIPMYIKLYEGVTGTKVNRACFVSINRHRYLSIVGELPGGRNMYSREEYEPSIKALDEGIRYFSRALETLDFAPGSVPGSKGLSRKTCASCDYKTICRSLYALNPRGDVYNRKVLPEKESGGEEEEDHVF